MILPIFFLIKEDLVDVADGKPLMWPKEDIGNAIEKIHAKEKKKEVELVFVKTQRSTCRYFRYFHQPTQSQNILQIAELTWCDKFKRGVEK